LEGGVEFGRGHEVVGEGELGGHCASGCDQAGE
jgi:hypothetical protein